MQTADPIRPTGYAVPPKRDPRSCPIAAAASQCTPVSVLPANRPNRPPVATAAPAASTMTRRTSNTCAILPHQRPETGQADSRSVST